MRTPATVLADLLACDATAPRITMYDEGTGERIELSAKVLANWVAKAANLLVEEFDVEPGTIVRLALPPHWRSAYWALAVWSVGGQVCTDAVGGDILITDDPQVEPLPDGNILVTLAALARRGENVPDDFIDEARELATFPDLFVPTHEVEPGAVAFDDQTYASLAEILAAPASVRAHTSSPNLANFLMDALVAWSGKGSIVLTRGELSEPARARRLAAERIDDDLDLELPD